MKFLRNNIRNNTSFIIVALCVIFSYMLIFPVILDWDTYLPNTDQWGSLIPLFVRVLQFIAPPSMSQLLLGWIFCLLLIFGIYKFVRVLERGLGSHYGLMAGVAFFFLVFNYKIYRSSNDVGFFSFIIIYISMVLYYYIYDKKISTKSFVGLFLIATIALGLRKNAFLVAPVLFFPLVNIYKRAYLISAFKKILMLIGLIIFSYGINPIIHHSLGLEKKYKDNVFLVSDTYCMRLLKNKPLGKYSPYGISHGQHVFMQLYGFEPYNGEIKVEKDWIAEIKEDPKVFFWERGICLAQFFSIGLLPRPIGSLIKWRFPNLILPEYNYFVVGAGNSFLSPSFAKINRNNIMFVCLNISPFDYAQKKKVLQQVYFGNWFIESRIILFIYLCLLCCTIFNVRNYNKGNKRIRISTWLELICVLYLFSFFLFTPTPDLRYHIFPFFMAVCCIGLNIDYFIENIKV